MPVNENIAKFLSDLKKEDPRAEENVVNYVRKTVPDFSYRRLVNILRGQPLREIEVVPFAQALDIHPRQLIARTPQDRDIANFAVARYRNEEDGNKGDRYCEYAENSADFRQGSAELDLDEIAVAFEADDELRIENEVFRLPKDDQQS